jgi:YVTN family beta-propeller protein
MLDNRDEYLKQIVKPTEYTSVQSADAPMEAARARSKGHPLAYVCIFSGNSVAVVDLVEARKVLDITVGLGPLGIDINRHRNMAYVSNFSGNSISVIELRNNVVIQTVKVGMQPAGVKTSRDGRYLYVVHYGEPSVYVLDAYSLQKVTEIPLPAIGFQIDITTDGLLAFVSLRNTAQVAVIDLGVNLVVKVLRAGAGTEDVKISPTNQLAFVTNEDGNSILPINVQLAEPASPTIATAGGPVGLAFIQWGRTLYCANRLDQSVSVLDVFSRVETAKIQVGNGPYGLAASVDERLAAVTNSFEDTLSIIDTRMNRVYATVNIGYAPAFLTIL